MTGRQNRSRGAFARRLRFSQRLIGQPPDAADGARAQLFRRRGRLTHRGDGDAQLDELRRGERNLRDGMAIPLYLDSARLAYALACPQNDVTLADIAAL